MRPALISTALGLALLTSACGEKAAPPERKAASGEILGGEISDAMLPLDSVRSTSPADPRRTSEDGAPMSGTAAPTAPAGGRAEPVEPSPEPATETPTPAAT